MTPNKKICLRCLTEHMRESGIFEQDMFDGDLLRRVESGNCMYCWTPWAHFNSVSKLVPTLTSGVPIKDVPDFCKYSLEHLMHHGDENEIQ